MIASDDQVQSGRYDSYQKMGLYKLLAARYHAFFNFFTSYVFV